LLGPVLGCGPVFGVLTGAGFAGFFGEPISGSNSMKSVTAFEYLLSTSDIIEFCFMHPSIGLNEIELPATTEILDVFNLSDFSFGITFCQNNGIPERWGIPYQTDISSSCILLTGMAPSVVTSSITHFFGCDRYL
jgi:hypothetical protein